MTARNPDREAKRDPRSWGTLTVRTFLSGRERRTVEAFADVFIEGQDETLTPAEIAANVDAQLGRVQSKRKRSLRLVLWVIEYVVPLLSLRGPFSRLSRATRRQIIEKHLVGPRAGRLMHNLAKVRTLFLVGYYGDTRVFPSIGFRAPAQQSRYKPGELSPLGRPELAVQPPAAGETTIQADICVIGSGAGGAVVAALASVHGARVVLLEEGRYVRTAELANDEPTMSAKLYKESGLQTTVDLEMTILQGRVLGGTTFINNAICFRIEDPTLAPGRDTLAQWAAFGARVERDKLHASYDRVEQAIRVRPLPETLAPTQANDPAGPNGDALLRGWRTLCERGIASQPFRSGLFRLNLNQCLTCGYCNFGCPYERRMSTLETFIPEAISHGARVVPECHAIRIETRGDRATGVRATMADGRPLRIEADTVVVACGAIGSSVLLLKSGIERNVGTRFSFNAATPVLARFPDRLDGFQGLQMTGFVDFGEYILESLFNPPMTTSVTMPGWFATHFERMRDYGRLATAGVVVGTQPNGRVKRCGALRDLFGPVDYRMAQPDLEAMKRGIATLAQIYFAAGAEAVFPSTFLDHELPASRFAPSGALDREAIIRYIATSIREPADLTLNSAHPQGGNPMSDRPDLGVVDSSFRVHGFANLFVADASVFPTSIGINPQLTVMALADYAWHNCISQVRERRA